MVICTCTALAIIDLDNYNFGLYIILLCIVGIMIACAFCITNPNACKNPSWYARFCLLLQHLGNNFFIIQFYLNISLRNGNQAAIAMLAPAVHIMHHVWKGMAWITEDISEEERVTNFRTPSISTPEDSASEWDPKNDVIL
uniref:Bm1707, isoform a n=1 Tax=Brugia malayi TaxID=6279 RepID=A0A0J9Y336_BRUMA|nr:Bm1707, isoform a [Brugia malayi]